MTSMYYFDILEIIRNSKQSCFWYPMCIFWKQLLISIICPYIRPEQHACNSRDTTTKYTERSPRIAHSPLPNHLKILVFKLHETAGPKKWMQFSLFKKSMYQCFTTFWERILAKTNLLTCRDKNGNWDVINTATVVSDRW